MSRIRSSASKLLRGIANFGFGTLGGRSRVPGTTPGPADLSEVVCFRPREAKAPWLRSRARSAGFRRCSQFHSEWWQFGAPIRIKLPTIILLKLLYNLFRDAARFAWPAATKSYDIMQNRAVARQGGGEFAGRFGEGLRGHAHDKRYGTLSGVQCRIAIKDGNRRNQQNNWNNLSRNGLN